MVTIRSPIIGSKFATLLVVVVGEILADGVLVGGKLLVVVSGILSVLAGGVLSVVVGGILSVVVGVANSPYF